MQNFSDFLNKWPANIRHSQANSAAKNDVISVLNKIDYSALSFSDFLVLLSPAASEMLEEIAQVASRITLNNFGKSINIFTPLYLSDICTNQCRYCGFNAKNKQKRRHLNIEEAMAEAFAIADNGFLHILLLTGDAPKIASVEYIAEICKKIKSKFASIGIEIYALTENEYKFLIQHGVDSMTMFQETYNANLYKWLHPAGPKADYLFRLEAPGRAAAAGMRSVGIGALLGLDDFVQDASATGLHAYWLQKNFPGTEINVSIPRIRPHEGEFEVKNAVSDSRLVQYILALRCFLPRAGIVCSSRENAFMRSNLLPLGVTKVSAGVSTAVGGRTVKNLHNKGQFEISDNRSLEQMTKDLLKAGYQPVLKDWEAPDIFNI